MSRGLRLTPEQFAALGAYNREIDYCSQEVQFLRNFDPAQRRRADSHAARVRACVLALNAMREVAWAAKFNTGQMKSPDGKRAIRFAFKGCADILGQLAGGTFLAVEVKTDKDRPSPDQRAFLERVDRAGGCAGWVRSADQAQRLVRAWMRQREARRRAAAGSS